MDNAKPGSIEEMRGWIDLVTEADKEGKTRTHIGFPKSFRGTIALAVSMLTFLAVFVQGIEAGRSFLCHVHLISSSCSVNTRVPDNKMSIPATAER